MKKICFILAIISMFILAGCGQQQMDIVEREPGAAPAEAPTETKKAPSTEVTAEVKEILERADKKVKSFSYYYSEPPTLTAADKFFVKGTKMMIKLYEPQQFDKRIYFDTVYLDTAAKTAVAYCEDPSDVRCPDKSREFDVDYDDYFRKTPYMWVKEITYAQKIGEEQLDQRDVDTLQYEEGGKTVTVWVNTFYGLAQKVVVEQGGSEHMCLFTDLNVNKLDDKDVVR